VRLFQTLNAPALLVDHDEHPAVAARRGLRIRDQAAKLIRAFDIAREEYEPCWARLAEKVSLASRKRQPRQSANKGAPLQASSS
jgi:hypothetical protein